MLSTAQMGSSLNEIRRHLTFMACIVTKNHAQFVFTFTYKTFWATSLQEIVIRAISVFLQDKKTHKTFPECRHC